jgi:glucokinase
VFRDVTTPKSLRVLLRGPAGKHSERALDMILAGDIGGTKCNLAAFEQRGPSLELAFQNRYATRDFSSFEQLVDAFTREAEQHNENASTIEFTAAGFGVAGTVLDGRLHAINLPWILDTKALAAKLNLQPQDIVLINDLVATACGIDKLPPQDFLALNEVVSQPHANKALIAAGTGLGEAMLFWDGTRYHAAPSEGGAADFAARNDREILLLDFLKQRLPRVSCEEVFSGRGFRRIHEFLDSTVRHASFEELAGDSAREITQNAIARSCPVCVETLDFWIDSFGSEAGNLALRVLAYGGVYLAGGIALKILSKLREGSFARSFADKAPLTSVLARIPIFVILNEDAPLLGAAYEAHSLAQARSLKPAAKVLRMSSSA